TAKSAYFYIVGTKDTCALKTKDSCDGRTDGFYCSVVNAYSGINCNGGQDLHVERLRQLSHPVLRQTARARLPASAEHHDLRRPTSLELPQRADHGHERTHRCVLVEHHHVRGRALEGVD